LEANHSGMAARMVSSDIHNAVSGRILALSNMQESVERLAGLAPFMFPLAQGRHMLFLSHKDCISFVYVFVSPGGALHL
jgi:hypothetical protein